MNTFLSPFAPENLISRDRFGRPSRVILLRLNLVLTNEMTPAFRGGVRSFLPPNRHRVSLEFIGSRNCVPMAFTAESPPAQWQYLKAVPVTGAALASHYGPVNVRLFSHAYYWVVVLMVDVGDTGSDGGFHFRRQTDSKCSSSSNRTNSRLQASLRIRKFLYSSNDLVTVTQGP